MLETLLYYVDKSVNLHKTTHTAYLPILSILAYTANVTCTSKETFEP